MAGPRTSTLARILRRRRLPDHMGHMGTVSLTTLPLEEPPMIICVRPSLINSTTVTRRLLRINTAPQLPGLMDNRRRGLLTSTDILHNPKARSMAKVLHRPGLREDTGVVGHRRPREVILEPDMALVGSNTHQARMDSLRPGRAVGVAIRRGIKPHRLH